MRIGPVIQEMSFKGFILFLALVANLFSETEPLVHGSSY